MSKRMAMFQIDGDFDFEDIFNCACEMMKEERDGSVYVEGGRPEASGHTPGAQIIMKFRSERSDSQIRMLISCKGKIQLFYEDIVDFAHSFLILNHLLGDKFRELKLIDVDLFEQRVAAFECRFIRIMSDRSAVCETVRLAPNKEMLLNNMRIALISFLSNIFKELNRAASGGGNSFKDFYESAFSWFTTLWESYAWLLIELWEDRNLAKEVINSSTEHLESLERKWEQDATLMENHLPAAEEWLIGRWTNISNYYNTR